MNIIYDYYVRVSIVIIIAIFCQLELTTTEANYIEWEYHEIPRPPKKLIPSEIMVDITNDLSYRILHFHSISNRNNIAFSPTALASVLIALYEGSSDRSSLELKHVLGLPGNRDITRIGYRDIHRRLRTYFFVQDNPLIGLSLNKENVTITPEYEAILKFYGYDLGMDMVSSTPSPSIVEVVAQSEKTTEIPDCITEMKTEEITTTMISQDKINEFEVETTSEKITTIELPPETTTAITTLPSKTEQTTMLPITTSTNPSITTSTIPPTTTTIEPFTESTTETIPRTTMYIRTFKPVLSQSAQFDRLRANPSPITVDNTLLPVNRRTNQIPFMMSATPIPSTVRQNRNRDKRHYFHSLDFNSGFHPADISNRNTNIDTDDVYVAFVPAPPILGAPLPPRTLIPQEFNVYDQLGLGGIPLDQSYITPKANSRNNIINHIFYLNPHETIQSTYKIYNSILNYNYLEPLKMSVLELELDAEEYNLIILLPDFNVDMDTAIASLKLAPSLRLLRKQLKPRWVQAIIPDFHIKGNIYLTNDLQNMGINDIFEPTRADFTPMSNENGIYVKHIEQSIDVHIRTRSIDQLKRNIAQQYRPIEVAVNHPFIFFIVDKELDVALMAGKVLNPLNVRIQ